jgi:glycerophosphoryl diester phosphodiesterase
MWIWQLSKSEAATPPRSPPRPRGRHLDRLRQELRRRHEPWAQFSPELVQALHANGLRACAWQFVYGNDPRRGGAGRDAVAAGADCLVIDAETATRASYAQAQQYMFALRAAIGPATRSG